MKTTRNVLRKYGSKLSAVALGAVVSGSAFAQSTGAAAALDQLKSEMGDYATPLFALAVVGAGIMIGIKYIKRGARAA